MFLNSYLGRYGEACVEPRNPDEVYQAPPGNRWFFSISYYPRLTELFGANNPYQAYIDERGASLLQAGELTFNAMKAINEELKRKDLASQLTQSGQSASASASAASFASSLNKTATSSSKDEQPNL